jgi:hypothetical protein
VERGDRGESVARLLAVVHDALRPGGTFRTFSYVHTMANPASWRLRRVLRRTFAASAVRGPVRRSVPPALVFAAARG